MELEGTFGDPFAHPLILVCSQSGETFPWGGVEERESCDVCPVKGERLPKLGQQQEKKKKGKSNHCRLREGKELSGKWSFLLWTYLCYKNGKTPGGQRPSLVPGVLEEGIAWLSGAQDVNWCK